MKDFLIGFVVVAALSVFLVFFLFSAARDASARTKADCADYFRFTPTARDSLVMLHNHPNCSDYVFSSQVTDHTK